MAGFQLKVIRPKHPNFLDPDVYERAIREGLKESADLVKKDLDATVDTWKHKPTFTIKLTGYTITVSTDSEIYGYVDKGTKPHIITAKSKARLRFQQGYSPKTSPGVIGSSEGGPSGDVLFRRVVKHPGTKARKFGKTIKERIAKVMPQRMREKIKKAAGG